jgi:hypothetical protein
MIRRLATLIEHTSSMPAAAISIPALNSKESHAILMGRRHTKSIDAIILRTLN